MTNLERTQAAYAHFTLEEWKLLARCVLNTYDKMREQYGEELAREKFVSVLGKFPSAAL